MAILLYGKYTYNTQYKLRSNKQHLSTKQHDYQSVLVTPCFGTVCVTLPCQLAFAFSRAGLLC